MNEYRLKITRSDFERLQELVFADLPREAGAFTLAGISEQRDCTDIIVRRTVAVPREYFAVQNEYRLEVSPQAINGLIALCEKNGLGAILCHSHPSDIPYSLSDDHGEKRVFEVLRKFVPPRVPTGSLLFYPGGVRGRVWPPDSARPVPISEIIVLGRRIERIRTHDSALSGAHEIDEVFDRQVRAFGSQGQAAVARAKVGIVGVGGTGSPTAEQLVRLGVNDIVLIDSDFLDPTNITRVYGTLESSLRRRWWSPGAKKPRKADIVGKHLTKIRPETNVQAVSQNVVLRSAAVYLLDRDVIFLCTDDHWGRSIVNQVAYQYFIPTINLGAHIAAEDGLIKGAAGVVDLLRPDNPCLWCSQFLRAERIAAESMPRRARKSREREGYVEGIDTPTPSVVSLTTALSGMAVTLFLQLVTDFMGPRGDVARLNYDLMDGTVRRGRAPGQTACVCTRVRGLGDLKPLPVLQDLSYLDG